MSRWSRDQLIDAYRDMMYKYGEMDPWDDDIQPKLSSMSYSEIYKNYKSDKEYYESRELAGGYFG